MWRLERFPMELMMKSVGYMIADTPSDALSRIQAIRMPTATRGVFAEGYAELSLSCWEYFEPLLPHLTSLHAVDISEEGLPSALRKCTSLRLLHFLGNTMRPVEDYLASQPRLDGIGVSLYVTNDILNVTRFGQDAVRLMDKLEHRPKVIYVGIPVWNTDRTPGSGWARGAEAVVLQGVVDDLDLSNDLFSTKVEKFLGVPLEKCWCIYDLSLDALCPDDRTLPLVATIWIGRRAPFDYPPLYIGMPIHRAAEMAHYLLQFHQQPPEALRRVLADVNTEFDWIWAVASQRGELRDPTAEKNLISSSVKYLSAMYKPWETIVWAIKRMKSITIQGDEDLCDARISSILRSLFKIDPIQQVLLTEEVTTENEPFVIEEVRHSTDKQLIFKLWNLNPPLTAEIIERRKITSYPGDFLPDLALSYAGARYLVTAPSSSQTFYCDPSVLMESKEVHRFILVWFTTWREQGVYEPNKELLKFAATQQKIVSAIQRHARIS
eukprot:TRINITY_DN2431_c1_g1_i1.p1 TRINITY_DN2431_c1_g1~~TRINITY_DN2431_c1_g1_i1.p1  ORF type:complete len:494 (+),score=46.25 TRINITY_DN2431_c1_g1_i1:161-1642(+)